MYGRGRAAAEDGKGPTAAALARPRLSALQMLCGCYLMCACVAHADAAGTLRKCLNRELPLRQQYGEVRSSSVVTHMYILC